MRVRENSMAQTTEKQPPMWQVSLMAIGGGIAMFIASAVLIQFVPIRLFVFGMILGPIIFPVGRLLPIIFFFPQKEPPPLLWGEPAEEMIAFHCRQCAQRLACARR